MTTLIDDFRNLLAHPRDIYSALEGIWLSYKTYLAKRLPLEQFMIDGVKSENLRRMTIFLDHEIKKRSRELADMKRINSIAKEVLADITL